MSMSETLISRRLAAIVADANEEPTTLLRSNFRYGDTNAGT